MRGTCACRLETIDWLCREKRDLLIRCAATSLNSKLISHQKDFFAPIVVDAVLSLDEDLPLDMIGIKKVPGGTLEVELGARVVEPEQLRRIPSLSRVSRSRRHSHTQDSSSSPRYLTTPKSAC